MNVYSHRPALLMRLDLEDLYERESRETPGFVERLNEGTYFGHTVEHVTLEMAGLARASIPVPEGEVVRTEEAAVAALGAIGGAVAVKPLDGRQGKGVSLNLSTPEEVEAAFRIAQEHSRDVLVEEMFEGRNYRALALVAGTNVSTPSASSEAPFNKPLRLLLISKLKPPCPFVSLRAPPCRRSVSLAVSGYNPVPLAVRRGSKGKARTSSSKVSALTR